MVTYRDSGPMDFEELVAPFPEEIRSTAKSLREVVRATLPDAVETVSGGARIGMALYSIEGPNDVVCGIQPTEKMCRLFFHGWEQLRDSGYRLEGSGKNARHVKIRSVQEIEANDIADMVRIAHKAR